MLNWDDLQVGMFVVVEALDHFEGDLNDDEQKIIEYPFRVRGEVLHVDGAQVYIEGAWDWLNDPDWNFGEITTTFGKFGVVRGAVTSIRKLVIGETF